jgi:alpha-galactosidase
MMDALLATNSKIFYSLCNWGADFVWAREPQVGNSWRVGDITNTWYSVASIAASNAGITSYAASGGFNDYDIIEIGNGSLSAAEERAYFGL